MFQWISTANTHYGRKALAELLEKPDKQIERIKIRQKAIRELSAREDFCQKLQCEGMLAKGIAVDPQNLLSFTEDTSRRFKGEWVQNLFYVLPASVILAFVLFFLGGPIPLFVPLILLAFQMTVSAVGYSKNSEITNSVYGMKKQLGAFGNLLQLIEEESFENETLRGLKKQLFNEKQPASEALKKLEKVSSAIDIKFSTVVYFLFNFGLLWDYHCVFALEEWKRQYGSRVRKWLDAIGQIEAYASLAVIGQINPEWDFPEFHKEGLAFSAVQMGHPLIPHESCICNDFEIKSGACVITGSNMSGKTTLLRTIGINLVLAYAGAPVFAQKLECPVLDMFTSMRVRDDLNGGISTFYAELLRIREIINYSQKKEPMIYLIDEIFKGNNSMDRIAGARSVLKNLSKS
ncbi:MAG: DNA mismatch repair protein MutS, partial [Bacillota bacterium]|nr:DNA mismatch repair protein MutS [Bacillota bacterium]